MFRFRVAITAALVVTVGMPLMAFHAAVARPFGDLDPSATCTPLPLVKEVALLPDGREAAAAVGDGLGRRYYFRLGGGTVTEVVPPDGFIPIESSDTALATYGIPPRPEGPAELQAWTNTWKTWRRADSAGICQTELSNR